MSLTGTHKALEEEAASNCLGKGQFSRTSNKLISHNILTHSVALFIIQFLQIFSLNQMVLLVHFGDITIPTFTSACFILLSTLVGRKKMLETSCFVSHTHATINMLCASSSSKFTEGNLMLR